MYSQLTMHPQRNAKKRLVSNPLTVKGAHEGRARKMSMPGLFDLSGRVAVVTGGNGGIGRGIALGLARAGAAVAIFGRNEEKNQHMLAELKAIGVPSLAVNVDLTQRAN